MKHRFHRCDKPCCLDRGSCCGCCRYAACNLEATSLYNEGFIILSEKPAPVKEPDNANSTLDLP